MKAIIANQKLDIVCESVDFFSHRLLSYRSSFSGLPDMTITSIINNNISPPTLKPIKKFKHSTLYDLSKNDYPYTKLFYQPSRTIKFNDDFSTVAIELSEIAYKGSMSLQDREYMATCEAFSNRMHFINSLMFHAAAISYNNHGICFSAVCGTGKSTQARLWCELFPHNVTHVNDDKPIISFSTDKNTLFGNPWSGKTAINNNIAVPLTTIVFLAQSPTDTISRLSQKKAYYHITNHAFRAYYNYATEEHCLSTCYALATELPMYFLSATKTENAVLLLKNQLEKDLLL